MNGVCGGRGFGQGRWEASIDQGGVTICLDGDDAHPEAWAEMWLTVAELKALLAMAEADDEFDRQCREIEKAG